MTAARLTLTVSFVTAWLAGSAAPLTAQVRRITGDSAAWIGVSGQVRLRGESWSSFNAGQPPAADLDDAFGLARLLIRVEGDYQGLLHGLVELKSSHASRRTLPGGVRLADHDEFDLQQYWAEVRTSAAGARVAARYGRFELALGRERLVGASDWTNTRRTFKGAQIAVAGRRVALLGFWTRPVAVRRRTPNISDSARALYGAVLSRDGPLTRQLYWLRNEARAATFNGTTGAERRHTIGARVTRSPRAGHLDADLEAAWQTGTVAGEDAGGWMIAAHVGRTFAGPRVLRLNAGVDAASGDDTPGGAVGTFNQLYPTGHAHLGYADLHGRQNVLALTAGAALRGPGRVAIQLDAWSFRRLTVNDALYAADGSVLRPAGGEEAAGQELDLTLRRPAVRGRMLLQAGVSRYFAARWLGRDVTFAYGQVTATF
jgi:hypothetical protein